MCMYHACAHAYGRFLTAEYVRVQGCSSCCPWLSILPFAAVTRPLLRHRPRHDQATPPNRHSRSRAPRSLLGGGGTARSLFVRCRRRFRGSSGIVEELDHVPVCNV